MPFCWSNCAARVNARRSRGGAAAASRFSCTQQPGGCLEHDANELNSIKENAGTFYPYAPVSRLLPSRFQWGLERSRRQRDFPSKPTKSGPYSRRSRPRQAITRASAASIVRVTMESGAIRFVSS